MTVRLYLDDKEGNTVFTKQFQDAKEVGELGLVRYGGRYFSFAHFCGHTIHGDDQGITFQEANLLDVGADWSAFPPPTDQVKETHIENIFKAISHGLEAMKSVVPYEEVDFEPIDPEKIDLDLFNRGMVSIDGQRYGISVYQTDVYKPKNKAAKTAQKPDETHGDCS
jgi:hypothetical protein